MKLSTDESRLLRDAGFHLLPPVHEFIFLVLGHRKDVNQRDGLTHLQDDTGQWSDGKTSLKNPSIATQDLLSASALYSSASNPALPAFGFVNPCLAFRKVTT